MRYANERKTYLTGFHTPDPTDIATPRWLSPRASGYLIAKGLDAHKDIFAPVPKMKRRRQRTRVPGVGLRPHQQPWKVEKVIADGILTVNEAKLLNGPDDAEAIETAKALALA